MAKKTVAKRRRCVRKKKTDWKGHLIDIAKAIIPLLIIGGLGMYVAVEKLKGDIANNKEFYAEKFQQAEKGMNNLSNWLKYISDKVDRHVEQDK